MVFLFVFPQFPSSTFDYHTTLVTFGPLDCKKVAEIDWQRVAEEINEKGYAMGVTILKDAK